MSLNNAGRQVLSVDDLSPVEVKEIFSRAAEFKAKGFSSSKIFERGFENAPVIALAFFEASTRTKLSFDSAAQRIGGKTIGFDDPSNTSSAKGEQLEDTLRVIEKYCDAIVIRRKEHDTIDVIREHVTKPIISAGVGSKEHPTQALLDVFTIGEHREVESLKHVVSYGDLLNSRCVVSQVRLLAREGIKFSFVAPDEMQITDEFRKELEGRGAQVLLTESLDEVIEDADMLHVLRPQRERWEGKDHKAYQSVDKSVFAKMKKDALVLHPLPRTGELDPETDSDPRSLILEQVENGLYVRGALLEWILS